MAAIDLSTTYLGLPLASPFMTGASPLADHLDTVRRLEDAGCAAIVLHSLFEEQITQAESGRIHHLDPLDRQFTTIVSYFPEPEAYALGPDEYPRTHQAREGRGQDSRDRLPQRHDFRGMGEIRDADRASRRGRAGTEYYAVNTEPDQTATEVETGLRRIVVDLKHELTIPVAVKLSPVLHGTCECRSRARTSWRGWPGALQSFSSTGYRCSPSGGLAASRAVHEQ